MLPRTKSGHRFDCFFIPALFSVFEFLASFPYKEYESVKREPEPERPLEKLIDFGVEIHIPVITFSGKQSCPA